MKHIAFIGAGNMGGALVRGACKALDPQEVLIYEPSQKAAAALSAETGCQVAASGAQAVREARYVMLCVKPQVLEPVLEGLLPALREGAQAGEHRVVVSIAAGVQLEALDQMLARGGLPVVRIMPNTPAAIGQGVLLIAPGPRVSGEDYAGLEQALGRCGLLERVTEQQLDQGSAISGCGPAFVYLFIEALADGGVKVGLPPGQADCLGIRPRPGRPRWWPARREWCFRRASIPGSSRMRCAPPGAPPSPAWPSWSRGLSGPWRPRPW